MNKQDKKLFDERFTVFWEKLNHRFVEKKKLNDELKSHFQKTMFDHFIELDKNKNLDVFRSLYYVFHIPIVIINCNERNKLKGYNSYTAKNFVDVIKYFLENDVTEYKACKEILTRNKLKSSLPDFITHFRKWYNDMWNEDSYNERFEYLRVKHERKMYSESPIKIKNLQINNKPIP